jgi:hypothetical protein
MELFQYKYGKESTGVWVQEYMYHALRTIAEHPDLTFIDIVTLLNPMTKDETDWVDKVVRGLKDAELRRWWDRHDNRGKRDQEKRADPVLSRIWQLASRPELKHILGQSKSTFQIADVLANNKILLINLKGISKEAASLMGTLLMNAIWHNVKGLQKDRATFLMLDEFADFMDLPIGTESMLAQARKHKLGLILANQHMSQLKPAVRDAVISNARSKIMFTGNADDGAMLGKHLAGEVSADDITKLPAYEAIAAVLTPLGPGGPVSITTRPRGKSSGQASVAAKRSRQKHARHVTEVHTEIQRRYTQPEKPGNRRPKLSSWDDDEL